MGEVQSMFPTTPQTRPRTPTRVRPGVPSIFVPTDQSKLCVPSFPRRPESECTSRRYRAGAHWMHHARSAHSSRRSARIRTRCALPRTRMCECVCAAQPGVLASHDMVFASRHLGRIETKEPTSVANQGALRALSQPPLLATTTLSREADYCPNSGPLLRCGCRSVHWPGSPCPTPARHDPAMGGRRDDEKARICGVRCTSPSLTHCVAYSTAETSR